MKYIISYVATAIVFFGLDFLWLSRISTSFYKTHLQGLLLDQPNLGIAALFYIFYVGGIVYFCVLPALAAGSWQQALFSGALLGLIAYGTYDITNLSTLKNWPVIVSVVDIVWGAFLTGLSALAGFWIATKITPQS